MFQEQLPIISSLGDVLAALLSGRDGFCLAKRVPRVQFGHNGQAVVLDGFQNCTLISCDRVLQLVVDVVKELLLLLSERSR